ncbi:MAG: VOC family protein, partial [Pseudomonadales bacterium]|nr:VOC family protein [Pseudomonadales bacterium]
MKNQIEALLTQYEENRLTRRQLVTSLLSAAGAAALGQPLLAQTVAPAAIGRSMNHVSLSVSDVTRSADFYQRVLGMEIISRPANGGLNLGLGEESFLGLYNIAGTRGMHHLCIGVDDYDADRLNARLAEHGIEGRVNRNPANRTSGGDQLYFND